MRSFHDFIACSACHRDYLVPSVPPSSPTSTLNPPPRSFTAPLPFYLTTCQHMICHSCLFGSRPDPQPLDQVRLACPACQTISPLAHLSPDDPSNEMSPYFGDTSELGTTFMMSTQFQLRTLMDQVAYLKPKCVQQKKSISRLLVEVKKVKGYKSEIEQLRQEVARLKEHLDHRPGPSNYPVPIREDRSDDNPAPREQYVGGSSRTLSSRQFEDDSANAHKRSRMQPTDSRASYRSHPTSNHHGPPDHEPQAREASYDQLRPSRLTLTPASRANHQLHHWPRPSSVAGIDSDLPPIKGIKSSMVIHPGSEGGTRRDGSDGGRGDGRSSRMSNVQGTSGGGGGSGNSTSLKEHLSNFTYTPTASRASNRPSPATGPSTYSAPSDSMFPPDLNQPHPAFNPHHSRPSSHTSEEDRRMMPPPRLDASSSSSRPSTALRTRPFVPNQPDPRSSPRHFEQAQPSNTPRRFGQGGARGA